MKQSKYNYFLSLFFYVFLSVLFYSCARTSSISCIYAPEKERSENEAILIIPGFGSRIYGNREQEKYFANKEYDVLIPKYIGRKSISQCLMNLEIFLNKNKISEYKKVHVFTYIIGGWVLNEYIKKQPDNNISSIVYDRSPLQERAPYVLVKDIPLFIRIISGPVMKDFSVTPYSPINKGKIKVGIIIESKATKLIRNHKKTALSLGDVKWDVKSLNQEYDDYLYTRLNHDEMYSRFDVVGEDIFYFFKNGKFSNNAVREPYSWDAFVPYEEKN
jgi:hypothetical protein